jgi:hypothetical protein
MPAASLGMTDVRTRERTRTCMKTHCFDRGSGRLRGRHKVALHFAAVFALSEIRFRAGSSSTRTLMRSPRRERRRADPEKRSDSCGGRARARLDALRRRQEGTERRDVGDAAPSSSIPGFHVLDRERRRGMPALQEQIGSRPGQRPRGGCLRAWAARRRPRRLTSPRGIFAASASFPAGAIARPPASLAMRSTSR